MSSSRVLCVGVDAVVLRDVRTCLPDAAISVARDEDDLLQKSTLGADLVVLGQGSAARAVSDLGIPVLAVLDPMADVGQIKADIVLRRPVGRRALGEALRYLLRPEAKPALEWLRRRIFDPATSWEPARVFSLLRLVVLLLVVVDVAGAEIGPSFLSSLGGSPSLHTAAVCAVATAHGLARVRWNGLDLGLSTLDAVVWLGLMLWLATVPSPFLLLMVVAFAQFGHAREWRSAVVATVVVAALTATTILLGDAGDLLVFLPLMVLAGCLGVGISIVIRGSDAAGRRALLEVQKSLTELHDHARRNPGRFEVTRVRRDAVLATREAVDADRVALFDLGDVEGLAIVDVGGWDHDNLEAWAIGGHLATALRSAGVVDDPALCRLVGGGALVIGAPLTVADRSRGLLLVAWDEEPPRVARRGLCQQLQGLAADAGLAIDNAEIFGAINELGARGERQRLARELHDGIIQSFVHVGFELERVSRDLADVDIPSALKVVDLRNVVGDAVAETRSIVSHLRDEASHEGLDAAVRRWLQASPSSGGPAVRYTAECLQPLPPEVVPDLLRVTQEAVANARQHARATQVQVMTAARGGDFILTIEDDGKARGPGPRVDGRGVGMRSMAERLARLGGELAVEEVVPTGTRIVATVPGLLATGVQR